MTPGLRCKIVPYDAPDATASCGQLAPYVPRRSAEIARFPKAKLPESIKPFHRAASDLIWATFAGASAHAKACDAEHMGLASADTFGRILAGHLKRHDAQLLFAVLGIYQQRHGRAFEIGGGFAIQITQLRAEAGE